MGKKEKKEGRNGDGKVQEEEGEKEAKKKEMRRGLFGFAAGRAGTGT